MSTTENGLPRVLLVEHGEALVGETVIVEGRQVTRYSVLPRKEILPSGVVRGSVEDVLSLAGAWKDDDPDEAAEFFERIRRESPPSPPIEFDEDE